VFTPSRFVSFRKRSMSEPIIGLVVAVGLGLYLLYTLLHPEKF
jgi:K+-transporting ATPase KdpF subunit